MNLSSKIKVSVLRGGGSSGYDDSLKTGEHILSTLREMDNIYEPHDVFISKEGEWHSEGLVQEPHQALAFTDVVWNALHGSYGEDGQVERALESLRVPYTGSTVVASALAINKDMARQLYARNDLLTPVHELITPDNYTDDHLISIFRSYIHPVIIKPASSKGYFDMTLAYTFNELKQKIKETLADSSRVLVEEYIGGEAMSCMVIEEARDEKIYALMPSYGTKSTLSSEDNKKIEETAKLAHRALGLRHYSSSRFIVTPRRKVYILETSSLPVLHEGSLAHYSLQSSGWKSQDFVNHVLRLAM